MTLIVYDKHGLEYLRIILNLKQSVSSAFHHYSIRSTEQIYDYKEM
jgi:hypothetical protein